MSGNVAHYLVANTPHTDDMVPDNVDKVVVVNDDMANTTDEVDDDALRSIHMDDDVDYSVKAVDGINTEETLFHIANKFDVLMESKGGKKKSSSSSSLQYEVPLGYSIEDVRPNGGIKKFRSAAYSNCVRKPS
ncbi:hypothetical protein J5N97_026836 [Dioscorea zingiberensis]|uniref:Uncharacterized protein n=1 Tax=Dioscorea zingiberensis TaxID=325984 RepID=A0A9D5C3W4_9LILI|nr:hypothetical protein J5N97_026836 [Dioscorea zingiberensis]